MKIRDLKFKDVVYDSKKGFDVMVEKVDESGTYILLDATFGASTLSEDVHKDWCENHGDDGRYSYSMNAAIQILHPPQTK